MILQMKLKTGYKKIMHMFIIELQLLMYIQLFDFISSV